MAVFTPVTREQARALLADYAAGALQALEPVAAGTENTNYFLDTDRGRYVLTLVEQPDAEALAYTVALTEHLAQRGFPCPAPLKRRDGRPIGRLCGRPALLLPRLPGRWEPRPDPVRCREAGGLLARMHQAARGFGRRRPQPYGIDWCRRQFETLAPGLRAADRGLLAAELEHLEAADFGALPQGVIHGDLFRDNVLFTDGEVGGVIDFYFAGDGPLLWDLAIAANDWCTLGDGRDGEREAALLAAYGAIRRLEDAEVRRWRDARRFGALRFWLSRLRDRLAPRPNALLAAKDPDEMRGLLRRLRGGADGGS